MSYSRSFTKRVAVHYSGRVNYPASEHGGSIPYSGTEYEDVTINIRVDTDAFDGSVKSCNSNVNLLTGAVTAAEAAQVASIRSNAEKVGQTIVNGFFKTVRSEISQQITELRNIVDATLIHMHELSRRCVDKQSQMEADYNRISKRYLQIFSDLDSELRNRVYELDRPTFVFRDESVKSSYRAISDDLVGAVAVSGAESGKAEARISASLAKKRALDTIGIANTFLMKQKATDNIIRECITDDAGEGMIYEPVCFLETSDEGDKIGRRIFRNETVSGVEDDVLMAGFAGGDCTRMPAGDMSSIKKYFDSAVVADMMADGAGSPDTDTHRERVKDYILRMFTDNNIKTY